MRGCKRAIKRLADLRFCRQLLHSHSSTRHAPGGIFEHSAISHPPKPPVLWPDPLGRSRLSRLRPISFFKPPHKVVGADCALDGTSRIFSRVEGTTNLGPYSLLSAACSRSAYYLMTTQRIERKIVGRQIVHLRMASPAITRVGNGGCPGLSL